MKACKIYQSCLNEVNRNRLAAGDPPVAYLNPIACNCCIDRDHTLDEVKERLANRKIKSTCKCLNDDIPLCPYCEHNASPGDTCPDGYHEICNGNPGHKCHNCKGDDAPFATSCTHCVSKCTRG